MCGVRGGRSITQYFVSVECDCVGGEGWTVINTIFCISGV